MTKEKLVEMLFESFSGDIARINFLGVTDRILAALEDEKKGEIVVAHITEPETISLEGTESCAFEFEAKEPCQLIFRPDSQKKGEGL